MTLSPGTVRALRRLCLDVIELDGEQDEAPSLEQMAQTARTLLPRLGSAAKSHQRKRERSAPRRAREDAARRDGGEHTARIRALLDKRSPRDCEFCQEAVGDDWHMHHIDSGGLRRNNQSDRNCAKVCSRCHRAFHRNERLALMRALAWSMDHEFHEARALIGRRLDKLDEAARAGRGGPDAQEGTK